MSAVLIAAGVAAGAAWWIGPWSAAFRYRRMDMVSLRQMLDRSPNDVLGWRTLGLRLAQEGDGVMAEPVLEKACALNPKDAETATALSEIWMEAHRLPEAFQLLKAAVSQNPRSISANMALGRLYRKKGSYLHASEAFQTVVSVDAHVQEAWYELAVCYLQTQQAAKAQAAIDEAIRQAPSLPRYLALKGSIDAAVGNIDAGLASTQRAAQLAPTSLKIQTNYANMLLAYHRSEQDLNAAEQVIGLVEQIDPQYPLLAYQHGELERLRGRWPQAVQYLERALQSAPNQDEIYYALSQVYRRVHRPADADKMQAIYSRRQSLRRQIDETRIALSNRAESAALYERLADLQLQMGDEESAMNSLKSGLEIAPRQVSLQTRLAKLQRARAATAGQP